MKPLPAAPLTDEDVGIWFRVQLLARVLPLQPQAMIADRRDAELMLGAQLQPLCVIHWRIGLHHLILLRGPPTGERLEWLD